MSADLRLTSPPAVTALVQAGSVVKIVIAGVGEQDAGLTLPADHVTTSFAAAKRLHQRWLDRSSSHLSS